MPKTRWSHSSAPKRSRRCFSSIAKPTAFANPWPSGPVVTSTPFGVAVLGVAGRARAPLAELADVVELEAEAGEVEHRVEQHRRVPGRQHEPVAVGPVGRGGVVLHDARPQHVRERRERHRRARVTGVRLLHRVHREAADHVDPALFELVSHVGPFLSARSQPRCTHCAPESASSAEPATQRSKTATLAVKLCRKLRPPIGPISPAQNAPRAAPARAAPRRPRRRGSARGRGAGRGRCR